MQQRLFGASSEKRKPAVEATPPASARKQRGHGPRAQPQLPVQEVVLPLDEADKVCGLCGGALKEWAGQTEDSQEVSVVERHFVWAHVRRKFVEAERVAPVRAEVLSLIGQLYAIEADLPQPHVLQGSNRPRHWRNGSRCDRRRPLRWWLPSASGRWPSARCQAVLCARRSSPCWSCGVG